MPVRPADSDGFADFDGYQTWYRVTGTIEPDGPPPVIVLHGGPGATHDYMLALSDLADTRPVVHYDQLGNGRSTHLQDRAGDGDFWTVDLFVRELTNLVAHLGLSDYHVLGQSLGGFLAQEFAFTHPGGLRGLVLADTASSFPDFVQHANALRADLPEDVEATLRQHEEAGTTSDPEYARAAQVYNDRYVCRVVPNPEEVAASFAAIDEDPTVYHTMNGPSEFHVIGSLKDWTSTDRLSLIDVPTLLVSGAYDEAGPPLQQTMAAAIRGADWKLFHDSSHMPHIEERERYMQVVGDFLTKTDARRTQG